MRAVVFAAMLVAVVTFYAILPTRFSYYWERDNQSGYGWFTVNDHLPLHSQGAIRKWEDRVKHDTGDSNVVVLYWGKVWSAE